MAEIVADQAEGLRRLLNRDFIRVVTVTGGGRGAGRTSVAVNLATSLAQRGKNVIVLDEQSGATNALHHFGLEARHDLLDVIRHKKTLEDVLVRGAEGVGVLPAARGVKALPGLSPEEQAWLVDAFNQLSGFVDVVVIDAVSGIADHALSLSLAAQEVMVVLTPEPAAITDAYALIKVLYREYGKQNFRILVNKVRDPAVADAVYENFVQVARRFLGVKPDRMGDIPQDEALRQAARLGRPVVEAFPASEAAAAFRRLADGVDGLPFPREGDHRLDGFMRKLIQTSRLTAEDSRV